VPRVTPIAAALTLLASAPVAALAQAPAPTSPTPSAAPALDSLRMPKAVTAQQGHARFLVGVRLSADARLTVQVLDSGGDVVQTRTDAAPRPAGRAYLRVEAVDSSGFQMLAGRYRIRIQATDAEGRTSNAAQAAFTLKLTAPRGRLPVYTVPLWRGFRRQAGTTTPGQLVAVVGPRSAAATAGIRRGDVITTVAGDSVATPGAWLTALRALPAGKPVQIELVRRGTAMTVTVTPGPDWEAEPDYARSLRVAVRRAPRTIAYSVAQARQLAETGKVAQAQRLWRSWPASWRSSAPGQIARGEILVQRESWKPALGAYNRARKRDRSMAAAEMGRGIALNELGRTTLAGAAFRAAGRMDPQDPGAAGFRAYALLRQDRWEAAIAEGQRAVRLDPRYADGFLPLGVGLLAVGDKPNGVRMLRRGLILLEDAARADRLIAQHLNPTDP
jgi:hypothetical protein